MPNLSQRALNLALLTCTALALVLHACGGASSSDRTAMPDASTNDAAAGHGTVAAAGNGAVGQAGAEAEGGMGGAPSAGADGGAADAGGGAAGASAAGEAGVGGDTSVSTAPCFTTFRFAPPAGTSAAVVSLTGEWNGFSTPGAALSGPDTNGAFSAQVQLNPGFYGYHFIVDGSSELDPNERFQKYVSGVANSGVVIADCHEPSLSLVTNVIARPAAGQGRYTAIVDFAAGAGAPPLEPSSVQITLRKDGSSSASSDFGVSALGSITLDVPNLADGKYSAFVTAKDQAGQSAPPLRLVFWIEAEAFESSDALVYSAMIDRFKDGDPTNDPSATTAGPNGSAISVDPREDYHGGDFAGITSSINDGTFDQLGVRVLSLSSFYTGASDAWPTTDGVHYTTGYAGDWPIKARQVEPRWGGESALHALVTAAHAHGMRVIMNLAMEHVHQEHEYIAAHPDWFKTTGCVCGANDCDATDHRFDCVDASYLPKIDWTNSAGAQQWQADAVWWLDSFDLDGYRFEAVKQTPDAAVLNLASAVRGEFEASGTRLYLLGETAAGWIDDTLPDNLPQYQLINGYLSDGLNGQLDSILYYSVPLNVFANHSFGMDHADYWARASSSQYLASAIMSPYIGSADTPRFITLASYRGQSAALDPGIPYNQWSNVAGPPPDAETYGRQRLALAWLLGLPGAPVLYYGDEYGEYGGTEPNNRSIWRTSSSLNTNEQATLSFVRKLGQARKALPALRRGAYIPVYDTDADVLVFARQDSAGNVALEALSRLDTPTQVMTPLPASLGLHESAVLHDRMGGSDVTVSGSAISVTLGAQGVAILAP